MDKELREEKIEQYLNKELRGKALEEFEQALKADKTLAEEVAIAKDLNEAMEDAPYEKAFEEQWEAIKHQNKTVEKTSSASKSKKWLVALVLLLILSISSFFVWKSFSNVTEEAIYANYYTPYPSDQATRSEATFEANYKAAITHYDNEKYAKAIPLLEDRLAKFPSETSTKILLGNCYLSTEPAQLPKAISLFEEVLANNPGLLKETTQWYLALAFLKDNQTESAQTLLKELAAKDMGKYPKLAQQLLTEF